MPLKPAIIKRENTASTVPDPEYQIPLELLLKIDIPIPESTPITPARNITAATGISAKL